MSFTNYFDALQQMCDDINSEIEANLSFLENKGPLVDHNFIKKVYSWAYHYLANDGKRMHGLSVILAYQACGGKQLDKIKKIAAAFQLYHHHTLVHDDIYDEDFMRRAYPTTHEFFVEWFKKQSDINKANIPCRLFINDSKRRGAITGFAYGKIIKALAFHMIIMADFSAVQTNQIIKLINWHDIFDNVAQLKDVYGEKGNVSNIDECQQTAWLKTGCLFEVGVTASGLLTHSSHSQIAALKKWAGNLGFAYQLQDDIEDLNDDSEKGKGRGIAMDLLYRKPTYLYALAKEMSSGEDKQYLCDWELGRSEISDEVINGIKAILTETGAIKVCQDKVYQLIEDGYQTLLAAQPAFDANYINLMKEFSLYFVSKGYWKREIKPPIAKILTLMD